MPIDFLTQRNQAEDATKRLIEGRNTQPDLSGIMGNRQQFLNQVGGQISGMTGLAPSYSQKVPTIDRKLQGLAAKQKYSASRQKYDALFQNALQRAQEAGLDTQSAVQYARQFAEQRRQQEFAGSEADKSRTFQRDQNKLKNQYADMNTALGSQYGGEDNDYGGALARVLLGTGVSLGTSYLMTKNALGKQNQPQPYKNPNTGLDYNQSGQLPYGPQPRSYGPVNPFMR